MHCVLRAPKLATPCHKKGRPFVRVYLQDAQKCISFLCIVRLCKGCLCVWAQRTPLIVYISTSSRILILEYIFGSGFHSSALLSMHAHAMHFYSPCVYVCTRVLFACCIFHYAKNCIPFFCCVSFRVLFFRNAFNEIARFTSCIFCAHCRHKKPEKTNEKMHSQLGWILWAFYISYIYLDVDAFFGNSRQYLLTWF